MPKVTIELEEHDARIVASAIGLALQLISDRGALVVGPLFLDDNTVQMMGNLLGLLSGNQRKTELFEQMEKGESIAPMVRLNIRRCHNLVATILKQTDPDVYARVAAKQGSTGG